MIEKNYRFEKNIEESKTKALKLARGISIAGKMVKVSGDRIKLPLEGRDLDAVFYRPCTDCDSTSLPLIIGFHGGGFLFGGCALDDAMWVNVASKLQVNVISVGYRQSPDYDWHYSLMDGIDAINYITEHAFLFSSDASNISLMGQSAGAMLSSSIIIKQNMDRNGFALDDRFENITSRLNDGITFKNSIMIYPLLDIATNPDDKGKGSLGSTICRIFAELHCSDINVYNPLVSPAFAPVDYLEGSPNTIISFCENDNLKHEANKYVTMLNNANVPVSSMIAEGMPHGYFESGFKEPTPFEYMFLGENGTALYENGALNYWAEKTIDFIRENMKK